MKKQTLFLLFALVFTHSANAATTCSRANLTRCLDSACAINVSSNPAARCQYCGTANAGVASDKPEMRSISVGTSVKYNLTARELKNAPTTPGERYTWAAKQCISRVSGCTADDVSEVYDPLIEQSCRAAGISIQLKQTLDTVAQQKSQTSCNATIQSCIISNSRCMSDFRNCSENNDFDKHFSECAISANGCDEYLTDIRNKLAENRDTAIKNAEIILTQIVSGYQNARSKKLENITNECKNNTARNTCINTVCENNMPNKCASGYESEKSMATQLCKFYDIACSTID